MKRRDVIRLGAAGATLGAVGAAGGLIGRAAAQQKLILKASDVHPAGYPTVEAIEAMGKKLEATTNGRLSVQMYAAMQLGGEKEAIEQAQVGALQLARVSVGALGPVVDELNVFNLPFLFRNTPHMQKVLDGEIGQELLDKVSNNPNTRLIGLCWMDAGARSMYDTKRSIKNIDDLKGLKFRVMGNPMFVDMMNALGGNGVSMGYDQVFSALQTGVVDGAENNPPSFVFDNHFQVAKHYTMTEHLIVPEILVLSRRTWDSLTADDKALVKKVGREAQFDERTRWVAYEKKAFDKMTEAGIDVEQIADKKPFQDAVKPVWEKYGPKIRRDDQAHPGGRVAGFAASHMIRSGHHTMPAIFRRAMDALYLLCVVVAGCALVLISAVIPWGVLYALRAQQRVLLARADGGAARHRADLHRRRRLLPHRRAYERVDPGQCPGPALAAPGPAARRGADGHGQRLHGDLGQRAGRGDLAPVDRRVSVSAGRPDLCADPDRRRDHLAVRDRAHADRPAAAARRASRRRPRLIG